MNGEADLKAAIAELEAFQATVIAELKNLEAAAGDPDGDIETLAQQVNASVVAMQAALPTGGSGTGSGGSSGSPPASA